MIPFACIVLAVAVRLAAPTEPAAGEPWLRGAAALFGIPTAESGPTETDVAVALPVGAVQHVAWLTAKIGGSADAADRAAWIRAHPASGAATLRIIWLAGAAAAAALAYTLARRTAGAAVASMAGVLTATASVGIAGTQRLDAWALAAPAACALFAARRTWIRSLLLGLALSFSPLAFLPALAAVVGGGSRERRAAALAIPFWLALDWSRLANLASIVEEVRRAFVGLGLVASIAGEPGRLLFALWGPGLGVLLLAAAGAWSLRRGGQGWAVLAGVVLYWIIPAVRGSQRPDGPGFLLPLLAVAAAQGAGMAIGAARAERRRVIATVVGLVVLVPPLLGATGHIAASVNRKARGQQLATIAAAEVGATGLLLRDPSVPDPGGGVASFPLPRHVTNPEVWDFAYWPGWYGEFTHVLFRMRTLESVAAAEERPGARAMMRALLRHADAVARLGNPSLDAGSWVLFKIRPGSPWGLEAGAADSLAGGPREAGYLGDLAGFLSEHGKPDRALGLLRLAVRWDATNAKLWNNLGSTLLLLREPKQAAEALEQGLKLRPDGLELHYNLGKAYYDGGIHARAMMEFHRAVAIDPSFASAHYELARAAIQEGNWPVAAEALRTYLRIVPQAANRAQVESALRDMERRIAAMRPGS